MSIYNIHNTRGISPLILNPSEENEIYKLSELSSKLLGCFNLSDKQIFQISYYILSLKKENEKINLTAIKEDKEIIIKHFYDSIYPIYFNKLFDEGKKVVDIGTGAGFPGIPLKIVYNEKEFLLLDTTGKKLNFIEKNIDLLKLEKIETLNVRAEEKAKDLNYRQQFDYAISRAVAPLNILLEYCTPYIKKSGYFIAYKSIKSKEEIDLCENAFKKLSLTLFRSIEYELPEEKGKRNLVIIRKEDNTKKEYPRNNSQIKKKPL